MGTRVVPLVEYIQGCALRKISGSPSGSQAFYLSRPDLKVGRPNKNFGEPFGLPSIPAGVPRPLKLVARVHLMRKYFVQTRNFNFWVWQKPACCLMKPIKVFVPFRFKTRNVSNAAELFRFQREKSKKFQQVYINFIKIFRSNTGKLCCVNTPYVFLINLIFFFILYIVIFFYQYIFLL